jgi:hypothetical protein
LKRRGKCRAVFISITIAPPATPHPEEHRQRVRAKRGPMTGSAMRLEGWQQFQL